MGKRVGRHEAVHVAMEQATALAGHGKSVVLPPEGAERLAQVHVMIAEPLPVLRQKGDATATNLPCLILAAGGCDYPSHVAQTAGQLGTFFNARWGHLEDLLPQLNRAAVMGQRRLGPADFAVDSALNQVRLKLARINLSSSPDGGDGSLFSRTRASLNFGAPRFRTELPQIGPVSGQEILRNVKVAQRVGVESAILVPLHR